MNVKFKVTFKKAGEAVGVMYYKHDWSNLMLSLAIMKRDGHVLGMEVLPVDWTPESTIDPLKWHADKDAWDAVDIHEVDGETLQELRTVREDMAAF